MPQLWVELVDCKSDAVTIVHDVICYFCTVFGLKTGKLIRSQYSEKKWRQHYYSADQKGAAKEHLEERAGKEILTLDFKYSRMALRNRELHARNDDDDDGGRWRRKHKTELDWEDSEEWSVTCVPQAETRFKSSQSRESDACCCLLCSGLWPSRPRHYCRLVAEKVHGLREHYLERRLTELIICSRLFPLPASST